MKSFKEILESTLDLDEQTNHYKVNDMVKFDLQAVSLANKGKKIVFDHGKIVKVHGNGDYTVKVGDVGDGSGDEVMVKNAQAYAFGGHDGDPNP
jgi:hypothetical protein